jgi:hypothetical protein
MTNIMRKAIIEWREKSELQGEVVHYLRGLRPNEIPFYSNHPYVFQIPENTFQQNSVALIKELVKSIQVHEVVHRLPPYLYVTTIDDATKITVAVELAPIKAELGDVLRFKAPDILAYTPEHVHVVIRFYKACGIEMVWAGIDPDDGRYILSSEANDMTLFAVALSDFQPVLKSIIQDILKQTRIPYRYVRYEVIGLGPNAVIDHYGIIDTSEWQDDTVDGGINELQ